MKQTLIIFAYFTLVLLSVTVQGQTSQGLEQLKKSIDNEISKGNCAQAQEYYERLIIVQKSDKDIERLKRSIAECNRLAREKEQQHQQAERERLAREERQRRERLIREEQQNQQDKHERLTPDFSFGIKGGLNLSHIINNTNEFDLSPKLKPGFNAGILLNMSFPKHNIFGLQTELLYSKQGFVNDGSAINFHYITLPLMAQFYVNKNSDSGNFFYFELGAYFSYLMSVTPNSMALTIGEYDFFSKQIEINLLDLEKGKDIGVAVGAGYEFDFGLVIGVRYNYGLSDMSKNLLWKNSNGVISLGFKF